MKSVYYVVIFFLLARTTSGDIDIIVKQCREDWCYGLSHEDPRYAGQEYHKKLLKLFGSGLSQIVYEDIPGWTSRVDLSESCKKSFKYVNQAIDKGEEWAFRLIDSSGKTPTAFLEGSVTSMGDYDECIGSKSPNGEVSGMYCMTDIFPMGYKGKIPRSDDRVSLNSMQHINDSAYYFGQCWPNGCSGRDIKNLVTEVIKPYPLMVYGDHSCDTRVTNSLLYRLRNIRLGSVIAFLFIFTTMSFVGYGTFNHLFRPQEKDWKYLRSFSVIENTFNLFYVDPKAQPETYLGLYAFTYFKMFAVLCGVAAHVLGSFELPLGLFLLSHHKELERLMTMPVLMPIFGDGGIVATTSLAGFGAMMMTYSAAKAGNIPYFRSVFLRGIRYILPILAIMSLDMLWYFPFSGPFASRVGEVLVDKCSKSWWRSVLHISTLFGDPIEICSGHTYSLAVDVQLFAIGLPAIILLAKRPKLGILYCLSWMAFGVGIGFYYVKRERVTPTLLVGRNPSIYQLEMFLKYIHMATSGYLFSYFSAMLAAYAVCSGILNKHAKNINHWFWLSGWIITAHIAQFAPLLTNTFDAVPREHVAYFVIGVRIVVAVEMVFFCTYLALLDLRDKLTKEEQTAKDKTNGNLAENSIQNGVNEAEKSFPTIPEKKQFSAFKAIFRLTFSIYMCNYLLVRSDFYTARHAFYTSLWTYVSSIPVFLFVHSISLSFLQQVKRIVAILLMMLPLSFLYHIFFIAPFFNLFNDLVKKKPSSSREKKSQ